ncbi:hypothetical protein LguiA_027923 [Lonicera macranthoides]
MTKQSSIPRRQSHSPYIHQPKKPRLTTLAFEPPTPAPKPHYKKKKPRRRKPPTIDASRKWVFSTRDFSNYKDKFVFVSYNILGVENASKHRDLYYKVPRNFLDWNHRKKLICEELTSYNPSILSFQEVDQFDDLYKLLRKYGFRGVYQARTGEARDGCAIFWKDELFSLLHQENIEFKRFGLRDNVAQLCVLKMVQDQLNPNLNAQASKALPSRSLLVGNIHVLFNPNRGDIKLGQIRLFLEKVHKLSEEWGNIPALIGGDLNSMPQSALYQFLASAELDIQLHERRKICGQNCPLEFPSFQSQNRGAASFYTSVSRPSLHRWSDEELELATGTTGVTQLRHQLKLCSAYLGVPGSSQTRDGYGEPLATTYHSKFMGTVDYIWHTEELVPVRVLETLPTDVLRKMGGLPSKKLGSDHLALVCELAFADDSNRI